MMLATLFAASCAKELVEEPVLNDEAKVTFSVNTPEIATRAYSDGTTATVLQYAVYNEAGEILPNLTKTDATINGSATVELQLTTGNTYSVIFWAAAPNAPYTVDFANKTMTVNYEGAVSNAENRDAFYKHHTFTVTGAQTETIELKRPFAQLNIGTADYTASTNAGYTPTQSAVTVKNIYKTLDLVEGEVSESVEVAFAAADIKKDETFPVAGNEYLAMNYLLVDSEKEVVDVEFTYTDGAKAKTRTVGSVPVQRNYRTNIYGKLLTSEVDINVEIKPEYDGTLETGLVAMDEKQLQQLLDEAGEGVTNITLGRDIVGDVVDVQKANRQIVINGGKHTYNGTIKVHGNSNFHAGASLTLQNINFVTNKAEENFVEALENGSERYSCNITVENCSFKAGVTRSTEYPSVVGVQVKASKNVVVKNCTATNMHSLLQAQSCDESVLVKDCTVNGKNGVAFKQVKNAVVEGTTITAAAYGIRFDGNTDNYGITVKDNTITAAQPFIVRKMTGKDNTITLEGTNTLTTDATYQIVITNGSDDETYVEPTGTYTLTGDDNFVVYPAIENYDAFLAKISDDTWYDDTKTELAIEDVADFAAFVETANSGNDFEGKTLKLTGDIDLYFKDVTALADGDPVTFRPIGDTKYNGGKPFKGTFDGQGHTIKNLYQNGWDLGYQWGTYGSYGLFGSLDGATVKNVVIEGSESYIEGGDVSFIAGSATGNCVFENITINSGVAATYNNGCGGIIGWSGAGNYTFKNITIGKDAVLGGLWGSFDSSIGGIVGQAEPGATYNFENVTINGRIDAYNDCTASYDYYNYRMCGMIIGRCEETTTIDGKNYPDLSKYNMTFNNVVVNYGDWMNYHYCRKSGERAVRVEPGYSYGGVAADRDHSTDNAHCMEWIPFNQLIGGDQYAVKGLPAVEGVTVNYPESFYSEQGYKVEGNTYSIYSGKGFKTIATTVLNDGSKTVTIELAKDIDLAGIEWPAVKTAAAFVLDGKGHAIKNLTTSAVEDHGFYSTAMFTSTRKATTIKNLVVENATVTGKGGDNSHGAVLVACNYAALNIEGVTVKNSTVSNCDRSAALVTYLYFTTASVKGCVVEGCEVNSIGTAGAILGMNNSHDFEATGNTVKNTTISSSEGSNKAGILIGTWQKAGTLNESGNVVENSKAINAGTETNNNIGREV